MTLYFGLKFAEICLFFSNKPTNKVSRRRLKKTVYAIIASKSMFITQQTLFDCLLLLYYGCQIRTWKLTKISREMQRKDVWATDMAIKCSWKHSRKEDRTEEKQGKT